MTSKFTDELIKIKEMPDIFISGSEIENVFRELGKSFQEVSNQNYSVEFEHKQVNIPDLADGFQNISLARICRGDNGKIFQISLPCTLAAFMAQKIFVGMVERYQYPVFLKIPTMTGKTIDITANNKEELEKAFKTMLNEPSVMKIIKSNLDKLNKDKVNKKI